MKQFVLGMVTASLCWGGLLLAQKKGIIHFLSFVSDSNDDVDSEAIPATLAVAETPDDKKDKKRHRKRSRKSPSSSSIGDSSQTGQYDMSEGMVGDSLDVGSREVSMGKGGEDQLLEREIDQGIDRVFSGIERCLLLLPPDASAEGKVIFGMNIAPSGQVTKVNLKGPSMMIKGETGACFTRTVKAVRFRSFNGPDMVVHYPVEFD
jgi:hypothetical protein